MSEEVGYAILKINMRKEKSSADRKESRFLKVSVSELSIESVFGE